MMFLLTLHSILRFGSSCSRRWRSFCALRWAGRKNAPSDRTARGLASAFAGLMDAQLLVGTLFFVWSGLVMPGSFALRRHWEHLFVMLLAVMAAHLPALWKQKDDQTRYRNGLAAVVLALVLVVAGVFALPGNRWLSITGLF